MENITFMNVNKHSENDINDLYEILKVKSHNISHNALPNYAEHKDFVINNPYRLWNIIRKKNLLIGNFYLSYENNIGINLINPSEKYYIFIIKKILKNYLPLKGKKSLRSEYFLINSNPSNQKLIKAIKSIGMEHIQNTYAYKG